MYLGMYTAMLVYLFQFLAEIWHMIAQWHDHGLKSNEVLLWALALIDASMIGNLLVMTTIGGYTIFVNELDYKNIKDRPRWLNVDFNSTTQKMKMGMSLIGVSAIHMLETFMKSASVSWDEVGKQISIHIVFIITTLAYCLFDKLTHPHHAPESSEHDHGH